MKKFAIATIIALTAAAASSTEIGITAGSNLARTTGGCGFIVGPMTCTQGSDREEVGITIGQRYGKLGVTAGFATSTGGSTITMPTDGAYKNQRQERYSLVAAYDVAKFGPVTVAATGGVAYLNNARDANGSAMTVGVGAVMPITKQVSVTADYARQYGQERVSQFDGNRVNVGVKYRF